MKFYLIHSGSEELEITSECQIGRREGHLKFSDELLSGTHAKLITDGEKLYITDLGSSNGTFVNKNKIEQLVPFEVFNGDQIEMGGQKMSIKCINPESTRVEASVSTPADDSTRIEEAGISIVKDEEAKLIEEIIEAEAEAEAEAEEKAVAEVVESIAVAAELTPKIEEVPAISIVREEAIAEPETNVEARLPEAAVIAIEEENLDAKENTNVELVPALEVKPDEIVESSQEIVASSEATHIEESPALAGMANSTSIEATHIETAPLATHEATHIEAPATEVAQTMSSSEATHIEAPAEEVAPPKPQLKIVENIEEKPKAAKLFISPAKITNSEAVESEPIASLAEPDASLEKQLAREEISEEAPNARPSNALVAVAHDIHALLGTTKLVVGSAVIVGVFAFLLTSKKNVTRSVAQTAPQTAPQSAQIQDNAASVTPITETAPISPQNEMPQATEQVQVEAPTQNTSEIAGTPPAQELNSSEKTPSDSPSASENKIASNEVKVNNDEVKRIVEEARKRYKEKNKVVAKKASLARKTPKLAKSTLPKANEVTLKSTKSDPYAEAALFMQLVKIRDEAKQSSSQRVKSALEVDAVELSANHYNKFRTAILLKWRSGRTIASVNERNKLKRTLQGQLVALNNREKAVRSKIALYVSGKIKSPF